MDKIDKALKKLSLNEREKIKGILVKIKKRLFKNLDVKKLKGRNDVFRVRKGQIRIVYRANGKGDIFILTIGRRNDINYKQ
ncbi:MAG: hypothetical protein ABID67_01585 [Candidatus Nealsonbacteria bacterium]